MKNMNGLDAFSAAGTSQVEYWNVHEGLPRPDFELEVKSAAVSGFTGLRWTPRPLS